ncbi:hypothetical protein DFA_11874 [Cavenderia fasciculata]|uniref:Uncharacterized protein n=1 Tax=Cavenderia fasciculata TaxID=261658 RepID=F4QEJ9_CACFS|nr:uncharacterized protein DFA_11874 [Cavenderia fasciculata]EGG14110.1 hypothetical protein DFA_11874 [Cavenderia fasciculata]|eukprot:XP_004350818.1 hypothetical protein DFA_11874 [Cavenderia fasciculata]
MYNIRVDTDQVEDGVIINISDKSILNVFTTSTQLIKILGPLLTLGCIIIGIIRKDTFGSPGTGIRFSKILVATLV